MIDGTYKIQIDVPFARNKEGMVALRTEGDTLFADIDVPILGKKSTQGHIEGDTFTAKGSSKVKLMGNVDYTLEGKVVGDDLFIDIYTNKGDFNLKGVRV